VGLEEYRLVLLKLEPFGAIYREEEGNSFSHKRKKKGGKIDHRKKKRGKKRRT